MEKEEITSVIERINEIKSEKRELEIKLTDIVLNYEGSVQEALKDGLVRLNFSTYPGFYRFLKR